MTFNPTFHCVWLFRNLETLTDDERALLFHAEGALWCLTCGRVRHECPGHDDPPPGSEMKLAA